MNRYKKTCLSLVFCGVATLSYAQGDAQSGGRRSDKGIPDSLYVEWYMGVNKSANENMPWKEMTTHPLAFGTFIALGKEFTPVWGWRVSLGYDCNKSRNVPQCESADAWGWQDVETFGDITMDLVDVFGRSRRWSAKMFAGAGGLYTFAFPKDKELSYIWPYSKNSRFLPAAHAGINVSYRVSERWKIGTELSHTMSGDMFNGVKGGFAYDGRTNLSVGVAYVMGKKRKKPQTTTLALCNRLDRAPYLPVIRPEHKDTRVRRIAGRTFLDFPVNETVIYPKYRKNTSKLRLMRESVERVLSGKSVAITSISLHGYASPESPYSNNTRLAKGRTAAIKEYLMSRYGFADSLFVTQYTPEDWVNLRSFIEDADRRLVKDNIWYENRELHETPVMPQSVLKYRDELLTVIDCDMEPDAKEEALKRVGGGEPYRWLYKYVYPGLRHTDYIIEYVAGQYTPQEARDLLYIHPEALSAEELYDVAMSYDEDDDEYYDAIVTAARLYPDDETANLNAATVCVRRKRLKDARHYADRAGNSEDAVYLRNVIKAMDGSAQWEMEDGKVKLKQ